MLDAYRIVRRHQLQAEGKPTDATSDPVLDLGLHKEGWNTPATWRLWRRRFEWDLRAAAYDSWLQKQEEQEILTERKRRLRERFDRDRRIIYLQMIALDRQVDSVLVLPNLGGFTRTEETERHGKGKSRTEILDHCKAVEQADAMRERLEKVYFGMTDVLLGGTMIRTERESDSAPVNTKGVFEWIADPSVPPELPSTPEAGGDQLPPAPPKQEQ
jgi:hypothetical protein